MEKYVTSRELSERLKTAGFPQETQYRYYIGDGYEGKLLNEHDWEQHFADECVREGEIVASPMTDELLEQLPPSILRPTVNAAYCLEIYPDHEKDSEMWWISYDNGMTGSDNFGILHTVIGTTTMPDALAEMWLWLKEHGLLSPNTEKNDV